jgi:hypothetical protein
VYHQEKQGMKYQLLFRIVKERPFVVSGNLLVFDQHPIILNGSPLNITGINSSLMLF